MLYIKYTFVFDVILFEIKFHYLQTAFKEINKIHALLIINKTSDTTLIHSFISYTEIKNKRFKPMKKNHFLSLFIVTFF